MHLVYDLASALFFLTRLAESRPLDEKDHKMAQTFEHSVFDRNQLVKKLNNPGSKIREGIE